MDAVAVISASGKPLMPTNPMRARKLIKKGKAVIYKYRPLFTIRLTERTDGDIQTIEYCCDTGYQHIGLSIKSRKHEYVNERRDLLPNETERHNDSRKYRKARRRRKLRHRACRRDNRHDNQICKDGYAPSIRNKRDQHISLYRSYTEILPVERAVFEMGQFDTQVLKAIEKGEPLPQGKDYQHGERYGYATLREEVFARDDYTCICCGKNAFKDKRILCVHHLGFRIGDRTNRLANLATVCTKCHTPKNHQPKGKLYNLKPELKDFKGATFMTMVRWDMLDKLKVVSKDIQVDVTYGAATKEARRDLKIKKSHANDAYCMGSFHPSHRTDLKRYEKCRRNNRVLSKFYDATYIDIRDGKKKKANALGCNRTKRRESRRSEKNERIYRGEKVSKGRIVLRTKRVVIRPGDIVYVGKKKYIVASSKNLGKQLKLADGSLLTTSKVTKIIHCGGWKTVTL